MITDQKIITRLKAYKSREEIDKFFDITNVLIESLSIDKNNPKFCLNVRNENDRKRISININSRLVGGFKNNEDDDEYLFMLYVEDAQELEAAGLEISKRDIPFAIVKDLNQAQTFFIKTSELKKKRRKSSLYG